MPGDDGLVVAVEVVDPPVVEGTEFDPAGTVVDVADGGTVVVEEDVVVVVRFGRVVVVAASAGTKRTGGVGAGRTAMKRAIVPMKTALRNTVDRRTFQFMVSPPWAAPSPAPTAR